MLRITAVPGPDELLVKLEGCVSGAWAHELDAWWHGTVTRRRGQRVRVDLTDVCHVDAAGREVMAVMHRGGARFVVAGCVMPEIVREIRESAGPCRRN
jgi:hypothetical protein